MKPVPDGPSKGWVSKLEPMLKEYYRARGWDENGVPQAKKLADLGIGRSDGGSAMIDERIYQQFCEIGRDLYDSNMISSHGGNHQHPPGRPDHHQAARRAVGPPEAARSDRDAASRRTTAAWRWPRPSCWPTARSISRRPALAICHCHPRTAIALSLSRDEIVPIDNEASYLLEEDARHLGRVCLRHAGDGEQARRRVAVVQDRHSARARQLRHRADAGRSVPLVVDAGRSVPDHLDGQDHQRAVHRISRDEQRVQ